MKRIKVDQKLCEGCMNCVLACMAEHNEEGKSIYDLDLTDIKNESRNHISINQNEKPTPLFCRHCEEPECVTACMSGAMTKDKKTGIVSCDEKQCASCFMCVMACPYGILKADDINKKVILKCDFCTEKSMPSCVENCPTGAIYVEEV